MSVKIFEEQKMFAPFLGEPLSHIVGQDPLECNLTHLRHTQK